MSILQGTGYAATVTPSSGAMTGYTAVLQVTAPDGTITTPAVITTTSFTATVPATQVGNYLLVWTLTGSPIQVVQDQFTVIPAALTLVNLAQVKGDLNRSLTDTSKDAKLRNWIRQSQSIIENITGPILPQSKTYVADGGINFFVLPDRWVQSITSIVENMGGTNYTITEQPLGSSTSQYGYTWDRTINKITRRDAAGSGMSFPFGSSNVLCVYVAGMSSVPDAIQRAASQMVMHWYKKDDQSVRGAFPAGANAADDVTMVGNYEVPNAVMGLLEQYRRNPGIF